MSRVEFDEQPLKVYAALEKAGEVDLLDAIDDATEILEDDPGDAKARVRAFTGGLWGIPLRTRYDDWLLVWEHPEDSPETVAVRYLGEDPFA